MVLLEWIFYLYNEGNSIFERQEKCYHCFSDRCSDMEIQTNAICLIIVLNGIHLYLSEAAYCIIICIINSVLRSIW